MNEELWRCAKEGEIDGLRNMLEQKANVNIQSTAVDFNLCQTSRNTALMCASCYGNVDCVKLLLQWKADVHIRNDFQDNALNWAALKGWLNCVQTLLDANADLHHADKWGNTALINASSKGHVDCVKHLLECKANINHQDNENRTSLSWASYRGHVDCVKLLLQYKADANNHRVDTALTLCCQYGNSTNAYLLRFILLSYGAHHDYNERKHQTLAAMTSKIAEYHSHLEDVLSNAVIVDTRIARRCHGLYHEPLEFVMQYCGLELIVPTTTTTTTTTDPIPLLLRDEGRPNSAEYWYNQFHPSS